MIPAFVRRRRPSSWPMLLFAVALYAAPLPGEAQVPEEYTNLQVLPEDIPRARLTAIMRGFTDALDMRCSTCHVGEEGLPLETYDFASDDKAAKLKAREMLRMVQAINDQFLAELPQRREPNVTVTCVTCHRGVSRPEPIESIVEQTMAAEDLDFAIERYRDLREEHYGSAAYDFTDAPLARLAQRIAAENPDAAMRLLEVNLEFNPESTQSLNLVGAIHERAGDNAAAIEAYRKVLAIDPDDRRAQQRLTELGGGV